MKRICNEGTCTACGVCKQVCPKKCIDKIFVEDGSFYYAIDEQLCIHCNRCERVCPSLSSTEFNEAQESFAAWKTDFKSHMESASGGLASAFYEYAADNDMYFAGTFLNEEFESRFYLTKNKNDIQKFKNSKYTFSFASDVYGEIIDKLKSGEDVLFIGLPCQVAALKNLEGLNKTKGKLLTVDLVCHGTPSPSYLQQHIHAIEKEKSKKFTQCFFRDAKFDTSNFAYTLYMHNSDKPDYIKYVDEDDNYQIGYHNALIYRDVCYSCTYAQRNRVGDLTIGDYHGLGKLAPYTHEKVNVSCLIINSEQGEYFIKEIEKEKTLTMHKRPLTEPMEGEHQFNSPSIAPPERERFIKKYIECQDFEEAADFAFKKYKRRNFIRRTLHVKQIKNGIMKMIPRSAKEQAKAILRKVKG